MPNKNSIVKELQIDALDENMRASVLLRKALVVANKLRLKDFEEWANKELSGYLETETCPNYRMMTGEVKAWNPYRGWIPVYFESSEQAELFSKRACGQSIPELEGLSLKSDRVYSMPFPKKNELEFVESNRGLTNPGLHVPPTRLCGIIETVKTIILQWTLKLEEDGILGEGLTFSAQEQEKALNSPASHVTNFYGPVGQSQIQQQSPGAVQITTGNDIIVADAIYLEQVKGLIPKVRDAIEKLGLDKAQVDEVKSELDTAEAQGRSPKPKRAIIKSSFETIQRILEGAAGGAAGQLIYEIGRLLAGG